MTDAERLRRAIEGKLDPIRLDWIEMAAALSPAEWAEIRRSSIKCPNGVLRCGSSFSRGRPVGPRELEAPLEWRAPMRDERVWRPTVRKT